MIVYKVDGKVPVRKAEEDIPCMKIVEFAHDCDDEKVCFTPYMYKNIDNAMLRGEKDMTPDLSCGSDCGIEHPTDEIAWVRSGYIHTHAYTPISDKVVYNEITFLLLEQSKDRPTSVAVYECVIPKGTEYIEGYTGGREHFKNYCSKAIRFGKKICEFTHEDSLRDIWEKFPEFREKEIDRKTEA